MGGSNQPSIVKFRRFRISLNFCLMCGSSVNLNLQTHYYLVKNSFGFLGYFKKKFCILLSEPTTGTTFEIGITNLMRNDFYTIGFVNITKNLVTGIVPIIALFILNFKVYKCLLERRAQVAELGLFVYFFKIVLHIFLNIWINFSFSYTICFQSVWNWTQISQHSIWHRGVIFLWTYFKNRFEHSSIFHHGKSC